MIRIEYQLDINAPIECVYQVSQDYSVRYEWDPFPESILFLQGATAIEKGTCVSVTAKNGLHMKVEFVQVLSPTTTAIVMRSGPRILKKFSGSWLFKSISPSETQAKFVYAIKAKGWSIPFISEPIVKWYFTRVVKLRLNGLKRYCEACYASSFEISKLSRLRKDLT